jgi:hypothetical protein
LNPFEIFLIKFQSDIATLGKARFSVTFDLIKQCSADDIAVVNVIVEVVVVGDVAVDNVIVDVVYVDVVVDVFCVDVVVVGDVVVDNVIVDVVNNIIIIQVFICHFHIFTLHNLQI